MQKKLVAAIAATILALVSLTGCAPQGVKIDSPVQIRDFSVVVSAESDQKGGTIAGVATLKNNSQKDAVLESVSTEDAGSVMFARNTTVDGKTEVKTLNTKITIPAGKTVKLMTERVYIMIMDLKKPLLAGDSIDLTLHFSDGSAPTLTFQAVIPIVTPSSDSSTSN